jgi:hypothetical protein
MPAVVMGFGAPVVLVLLVSMPRKYQLVAVPAQVDLDIAIPQVLGAGYLYHSVDLRYFGGLGFLQLTLEEVSASVDHIARHFICICRK